MVLIAFSFTGLQMSRVNEVQYKGLKQLKQLSLHLTTGCGKR